MATSKDVAARAGVSQATVSRVMRELPGVTEATAKKVLKAAREIGYVPHVAAQTMRTGRSGNVGVLVEDLVNPFYPELLEALDREARTKDLRLIFWLASEHANPAAMDAIQSGSIDGLIFTTATELTEELRAAIQKDRPLVLVNRRIPELPFDQIAMDNSAGGRLVAEHFVARGYRKIGFVGGHRNASTTVDRLKGFQEALAKFGQPLRSELVCFSEYSHQGGVDAYRKLLEIEPDLEAIFCANDLLATGVIDAHREASGREGEQIAVVGFDNVSLSEWSTYSLTTVRQDSTAMARWALRRILMRIEDPTVLAVQKLLPPELLLRRSSP